MKILWLYSRCNLGDRRDRDRDRMIVGFTTTCKSVPITKKYVIKFVTDLWQVHGFLRVLRFPPPTKTIRYIQSQKTGKQCNPTNKKTIKTELFSVLYLIWFFSPFQNRFIITIATGETDYTWLTTTSEKSKHKQMDS